MPSPSNRPIDRFPCYPKWETDSQNVLSRPCLFSGPSMFRSVLGAASRLGKTLTPVDIKQVLGLRSCYEVNPSSVFSPANQSSSLDARARVVQRCCCRGSFPHCHSEVRIQTLERIFDTRENEAIGYE